MPLTLPAMYYGDTSRRGLPYAKDPAVVPFGERYLLYYSLPSFSPEKKSPDSPEGWGIGIAESEDLTHWCKIGELIGAHDYERNGICAPGAIVVDDKVHLFYQTYGNGAKDAICHAVSEDGLTFHRNPTNPVFAPQGDWNNGRAIDADVFPWQGDLLLFYSTRDPSGTRQIAGLAAAQRDSDWGRDAWRMIGNGPILSPELPWEKNCIEASAVCEHNGKLYLFYAGGYNNEPQQIGCAVCVSEDLTRWERISEEPLLPNGEPGTWNTSESGHPFVFTDTDGAHHLFYQGNNDNGQTWLLSRNTISWSGDRPYLTNL